MLPILMEIDRGNRYATQIQNSLMSGFPMGKVAEFCSNIFTEKKKVVKLFASNMTIV
jgi:hypothetical protein